MAEIGARIYWDKATGNVILNTGHKSGPVVETTVEQDFETHIQLKERVPETVGMIQLEYGQYQQEFREGHKPNVDVETGLLNFALPSTQPEQPPVYQQPLSEQIAEVKAEKEKLKQQVAQMNNDFVGFQSFIFEKFPELA